MTAQYAPRTLMVLFVQPAQSVMLLPKLSALYSPREYQAPFGIGMPLEVLRTSSSPVHAWALTDVQPVDGCSHAVLIAC
jgi:hypothetical protein